MDLITIKNSYSDWQDYVNSLVQRQDVANAKITAKFIDAKILTLPELKASDKELTSKYQALSAKLKGICFFNLLEKQVSNFFASDIALVFDFDLAVLKKNLDHYFDRFVITSELQQQRNILVNGLLSNNFRLTANPIVTADNKKIAPTVSNWIKYFYLQVGGEAAPSRLKIAQFYTADPNVTKLPETEKTKVRNLLSIQEYLRRPLEDIEIKQMDNTTFSIDENTLAYMQDGDMQLINLPVTAKESPKIVSETGNVEEKRPSGLPFEIKARQKLQPIGTKMRPLKTANVKQTTVAPVLAVEKSVKKVSAQAVSPGPVKKVEILKEVLPTKNKIKPIMPGPQAASKSVSWPAVKNDKLLLKTKPAKIALQAQEERVALPTLTQKALQKIAQTGQISKQLTNNSVKKAEPFKTKTSVSDKNTPNQAKAVLLKPQVVKEPPKNLPVRQDTAVTYKELSLEDKIKALYLGQASENNLIAQEQKRLESLSVDELVQKLNEGLLLRQKIKVVAVLKILASKGALSQLLKNKGLLEATKNYIAKTSGGQAMSAVWNVAAFMAVLRTVFEDQLKLSAAESARFGLHIVNSLPAKLKEPLASVAYYDMAQERFVWSES